MDKDKKRRLCLEAAKIRRHGLEAVEAAQSGHIGGSFSIAEMLSVLYFDKLRIDPRDPHKKDRDRLVLSKGHCSPSLYAALALRGYFPVADLKTFRQVDSYLSGHVEMRGVPGVDMTAGSLGQGLSVALGMTLSARLDGQDYRVYAITGDGELEEGQVWEAAMAAAHYKADRLRLLVDNNRLQIEGKVAEVMSVYPLEEKFAAFGWKTLTIDGHDVEAIAGALEEADQVRGQPTAIIAHTVKGKGASVFEDKVKFHGSKPTAEEFAQAFRELDAQIKELEG